jgi:serine/threonine-protein kinase
LNELDTDRWQRVQELFLHGAELPEDAVGSWLESLWQHEHREVVNEVQRLLRASVNADRRVELAIEQVAVDLTQSGALPPGLTSPELKFQPGSMLGVFRVEEELGRGGMSTVYLASRSDQEFEQKVAIKVLRRNFSNPEQERRLLAERQILAHLSHPNIARLLDGGRTPDGWPYFVMEVIDGLPIDRYCDDHRLSLAQRIRLFQKVCKAVHYAHRNLVVHRDIKPSNVLVAADGEPKLLDFGIAKVLDPAFSYENTATVNRMGTPGYTSPEQILGHPITTASDVYNLGVLLYQLLTGCRPYEFSDSTPGREIEAAILSKPPILPSIAPIDGQIAAARKERPDSLKRRLSGDLDNIVLTALRQEPERRYKSVEHLAEDLDRYLGGHPVRARTDSLLYRTHKFIRRHWVGVATTLGTVLISVLFVIALVRQQADTELQRDRAEQVSQMLVSLFELGGPNPSKGNSLTARELLDLGREQLDLLEAQDETQAMLRDTLGGLYEELGLFGEAEELYQLAYRQRLDELGEADPLVAESLYSLARAMARSGDLARAIPFFREALELRREYLGEDHPDVAASLNGLALALHEIGQYGTAGVQYQLALAQSERLTGAKSLQTVKILGNLALLLYDQGEYDQAEQMFRQALDGYQSFDGPGTMYAEMLDGLAQTMLAQGDTEAAEATAREALSMRHEMLGMSHPEVARSLAHLASVALLRSPAEALPLATEALLQRQQWLGQENAETAESLAILAAIQAAMGRVEEAESLYRQAIEIYAASLGPTHQLTARPVAELGLQLAAALDCKRALPLLQAAASRLPPKDRRMAAVKVALDRCERVF